jgi:biotin carboxylase
VRHAHGIDLIRETLRLVVGQDPEVEPRRHRHASIRFLFSPGAGRLEEVEGMGEAQRVEGVVDVTLYRGIGDLLEVHGDFRDRIGHVMACADDFDAAASAAERGREAVRVLVAEPAGALKEGS